MENKLMQFDLMTGEDYPIELQNQDNQDLYKANLVAISALEKYKYFANCMNCNCCDGEGNCEKFNIEVDEECDGCTFYED